MKPTVLFITKVSFLDAALEYIDEVKDYTELSVLIEIDPHSKNKNIINIERLPTNITFINAKELLSPQDYQKFSHYIEGCKSFDFFVHQHSKSFSFSSVKKSFLLYKKTINIRPNFVHFDDVSLRLVVFAFFLNFVKTKLIMNVHDPIQHTGEKDRKNLFARGIFYRKVYKFVTFSKYSKSIFIQKYGKKQNCVNLNLKPYKFYLNYRQSNYDEASYITFIGRISEYKGIDIFLDAINILNIKYPEANYIIAGSPNNDSLAGILKKKKSFKNVKLILNHLSNKEVCNIIQQSKVVVCPYRDATQSGVVMTSLALFTPVIVSNQGGLPEYIQNNITGMIVNSDAESFANAIETFIIDISKYKQLSENVMNMDLNEFVFGKNKILKLYS